MLCAYGKEGSQRTEEYCAQQLAAKVTFFVLKLSSTLLHEVLRSSGAETISTHIFLNFVAALVWFCHSEMARLFARTSVLFKMST